MKNKLIFIFIVLLDLNVKSQFNCQDVLYNSDTLVIINDELFSGYCDSYNKKGKIISKSYIGYGVLDSMIYFDKNGIVEAVEPYKKWIIEGTLKTYYKSGALKETIGYKNGKIFGLWRKYYENGQIKYEADFIDEHTTKNDSYYTWTKKGVKYLHECNIIEKEKTIGKITSFSARTKCKKVKIENTL